MSYGLDIPSIILAEKNQLATQRRFIWLYEIEVPTNPITMYRLTRQPVAQSYQGYTYSPFPIAHDILNRASDGSTPSLQLQVSSISREISSTMESHQGLVGSKVRVILAHTLKMGDNGAPVAMDEFEVIGSSLDEERATFSLACQDLYDARVPKARISRFQCRHLYRSAECGYSLDPGDANFLPTCDKTLYGTNGCSVHGASYTNAGLVPVHPDRFGGFPGAPAPPVNNVL